MENIFAGLYGYFEKRRKLFVACFIFSFLLVTFFAVRVRFEEDISKVLPKDKQTEKLNEIFQNSRFLDRLVLMISMKDTVSAPQPDSLVAYADVFAESLRKKLSPYMLRLNDKVDDAVTLDLFNTINDHLPVYLDEQDYQSIDSLITAQKIKETLEKDLRTLGSPAGLALKKIISSDPVGLSYLGLKKMQQLQYDDNFELYDNYVITKDHTHLLLFITPAYPPNNTGKNARLLAGIDGITDSLYSAGFKKTQASYFGATAVSVGNALQLRKDSLFTQGITVLFLIVFIGWYFRKKSAPVIILVPVLFGALFSLSAIYFIKGSISVIALGTGSVVLGVAVNYSLHVFNHYRHTGSMQQVIRDLVLPLTVGSFTTIGGFLCLEFVKSEMLKDLGLFAAFSLIGASLCSLIFLPHLVVSKKDRPNPEPKNSWIDRLSACRPEYNSLLVIVIVLLTIVFAYTAGSVGFETDLTKMNFMSAQLKESQKKLDRINAFSLQSIFLVSEGSQLNEALSNTEKLSGKIDALKKRGIIKKYSSVSTLILSDSLQQLRIDRWNRFWTAGKKKQLLDNLEKEGASLKFRPAAFDQFKSFLNNHFEPANAGAMDEIRKDFFADYITETPGKASVITLVKVAPEDKPAVYAAFDKEPHTTVLDRQYLTTQFIGIINSDFTRIALMSSILVFVVLLLTYGRIELTLISFVPMFITFIWILGIMGIFGIQFNIINIIISAFIFGLGDDYSLFIMDGLLQEYKTGKKNLSSYKSSIFLSAITTMAGLGVLIFAKHPALRSIAIISIIGICCVVIMSQILIPFLFNLLIRNRTQKKQFPWTASGLFKSVFSFAYFTVASLLLALLGWIFVKLNPFNKEKGKLIFHGLVSKFCWSLMYIMGNVKKRLVNPLREDFSKPAVIVCNHQSFLDILMTVMLNPKLILLTNQWVWRSPVFGTVVRMADYYPVMQGAQSSIDLLADRVKHGYSIVVFPEGTRMVDGNMKRFHKGAFYLAETLQLDILPIVIHGSGYTMTKGDFLLKDGYITLTFLPRIAAGDSRFGTGYAERAKRIGRYFREELSRLSQQLGQPFFFREQLIYNYLYKGPVLEWYLKIKLRLEKNYQVFHDLLPKEGKILDAGCGYGFMSYMLQFTAPGREITGIDYDGEKIATATHCFSRNERMQFIHTDIMAHHFSEYDGIVVSDVLHYLQPDQQQEFVEKCIRHLKPGGTLIIRDGDKDLKARHKRTKFTEFISTRLYGFNKTSGNGLSFISAGFIREIAAQHRVSYQEMDRSKYTSNIIFVIKNNRAVSHATV